MQPMVPYNAAPFRDACDVIRNIEEQCRQVARKEKKTTVERWNCIHNKMSIDEYPQRPIDDSG